MVVMAVQIAYFRSSPGWLAGVGSEFHLYLVRDNKDSAGGWKTALTVAARPAREKNKYFDKACINLPPLTTGTGTVLHHLILIICKYQVL